MIFNGYILYVSVILLLKPIGDPLYEIIHKELSAVCEVSMRYLATQDGHHGQGLKSTFVQLEFKYYIQ